MDKFEYKIEKVNYSWILNGDERLREVCKLRGQQGWELVSTQYHFFTTQYNLFFKRKANSKITD